ncbi:MAG: glutathione S-transferase [Pseudomonadota bacterium]
MADYRLHCFCQSGNAYKVALYLNCAGLDWEPVFVDFMNGMTRDPDWRSRTNVMGEVPVLEADGKQLTQSGIILTYLADKTGKFAPQGEDAKLEAWRWILFDNHKFTSFFAAHRFMRSFAPTPTDPAVLAMLKGRAEAAYGVVESHLADNSFVLGDAPTIADFSLAGYVYYPDNETGFNLAQDYPNIDAWRQRLRGLDGWADPYDLLPGERIPPRAQP